jgi:hypothetical protein
LNRSPPTGVSVNVTVVPSGYDAEQVCRELQLIEPSLLRTAPGYPVTVTVRLTGGIGENVAVTA